jgi:hypothetical protein
MEAYYIHFYAIYFTVVTYGFYFGDLVFAILTQSAGHLNSDDLFYAGLPYAIVFPLLLFCEGADKGYLEDNQMNTIVVGVFGIVLIFAHLASAP